MPSPAGWGAGLVVCTHRWGHAAVRSEQFDRGIDMSEEQLETVTIDELELRGDDDDVLEQDQSQEATAEAGLTEKGVELAPTDAVEFEEDYSGVAR
jgi:hypothetical protein